jgi:flagellum-specific ATP synthase
MAEYNDKRDLIEIGAYARGSNALVDQAIDLRQGIDRFLCQSITEHADIDESWSTLATLLDADTSSSEASAA